MEKKRGGGRNAGCLRSGFAASSAITLWNSQPQKGLENALAVPGLVSCPSRAQAEAVDPSHHSQKAPKRVMRPKQQPGEQDLFRREEGAAPSQARSICSGGTRMWRFMPSTRRLCPDHLRLTLPQATAWECHLALQDLSSFFGGSRSIRMLPPEPFFWDRQRHLPALQHSLPGKRFIQQEPGRWSVEDCLSQPSESLFSRLRVFFFNT